MTAAPRQNTREDWVVFASVVLAAWGYTTSTTIANAVLTQMQGDLSASLDQIAWVVTASVVAGAIGIPPTPWLAARLGLKTLLLGALCSFTLSSAMIGASDTLAEVVLWRISQAFFGAPIMVLSQTIILNLFPPERRGLPMAMWSVALTTGWVFGPAIGAYLADWYSWELSFFILAPVSALSIVACFFALPRTDSLDRVQLDWPGFASLSVFLLAIQVALNRGHRLDWFQSPEIIGWLVLAMSALLVYVLHTLNSTKRLIRWSIFLDRNFAVGIIISAAYAFISIAPLVLVPAMLAQLRGLEPFTVGLAVAPRGITQMVTMLALGAFVTRIDARIPISIGLLFLAAGNWLMAGYNMEIGLWEIYLPQLLHGVGCALVWLPIFNMLYATLGEDLRTDAATMVGLTYSIGGGTSVAVLVSLLGRAERINAEEMRGLVSSTSEILRLPGYASLRMKDASSLAALQSEISNQALMIGYVNLFWLLMWLCLAVLPLMLLVPRPKTETME